jgi:hypothetical protein
MTEPKQRGGARKGAAQRQAEQRQRDIEAGIKPLNLGRVPVKHHETIKEFVAKLLRSA